MSRREIVIRVVLGMCGGAVSGVISMAPVLLVCFGFIVDGIENVVAFWTLIGGLVGASIGIIATVKRMHVLYGTLVIFPLLALCVLWVLIRW